MTYGQPPRSLAAVATAVLTVATGGLASAALTPTEELGKQLFFDEDLSAGRNQSCASCHAPAFGFTGPSQVINATGAIYEGSVSGRFGNRKPPSAAYGGDSPVLARDSSGVWTGGMFWDGRATGWTLGDPLAEQALGPFLNPLEQALPDAAELVARVCASAYATLFLRQCGSAACGEVTDAFECVGRAIAAYERSSEVSPFSSKYDYYLSSPAAYPLSDQELDGLALFEGKAGCAACHPSQADDDRPLFTDFSYDNLGIPRNPLNPFYFEPDWNPLGTRWVDEGLGTFLRSAGFPIKIAGKLIGAHKVPTLRNVAKRPTAGAIKAYGHNGYFKSLPEIVHFYNTRDTLPTCGKGAAGPPAGVSECWPKAEVPRNANRTELGRLGLTPEEEAALVAFLATLSDGWTP